MRIIAPNRAISVPRNWQKKRPSSEITTQAERLPRGISAKRSEAEASGRSPGWHIRLCPGAPGARVLPPATRPRDRYLTRATLAGANQAAFLCGSGTSAAPPPPRSSCAGARPRGRHGPGAQVAALKKPPAVHGQRRFARNRRTACGNEADSDADL